MATFDLKAFYSALNETNKTQSGVDFTGKSLKLDTANDAKDIVSAISACPDLHYLTLTGNTLGVPAAEAIAKALESHPELKVAQWSDMFTGRMKTEIPPALKALGDGMIAAGARLKVLDLSDNAFGPIGVEGLAKLLQSDVCSELEELRLNNNGLGIAGANILARALSARPPRLRVLVAGRNRLESAGATALAEVFKKMGSLEEVAMPQNGIYHPGIAALSAAFKLNPRLGCLNLNDNTIGPKGAVAVAEALPSLKNLKAINFGDCLLKSKGAKTLAKALKDNSLLIEYLDLSHNEISSEACRELVDAVAGAPGRAARLARVVLAGNRLGAEDARRRMRDLLGAAAELDDDDDDDDGGQEDESESEDESDNESQGENTEDSATEDAQHSVNNTADSASVVLDTSGAEEVQNDVERFLKEPTIENLDRLGPNAADVIEAHLESIQDSEELLSQYVDSTLCVAGLSLASARARDAAQALLARTVARARGAPGAPGAPGSAQAWPLAERLLRGLALIKSEEKSPIRWHLPGCYAALATALPAPGFPAPLRATLRFFFGAKRAALPEDLRQALQNHPVLICD